MFKHILMPTDGSEHSERAVLRGIEVEKLVGNGSLYKVKPLTDTTTQLLIGSIPNQESEPIAWTNTCSSALVTVTRCAPSASHAARDWSKSRTPVSAE